MPDHTGPAAIAREAAEKIDLAGSLNTWNPDDGIKRAASIILSALAPIVAERDAAREILRDLEWSEMGDCDELVCPWCDLTKTNGHAPDCRLAAALNPPPNGAKP